MWNKPTAQATSLVKALRVLLALADHPEGRGVTDIARALSLPKSAVHRLLATFQAHGFVQQQLQNSRYTLGPTLARLGLRAVDICTPRRMARPYLEALAHEVDAAVLLGVLTPEGVLVVEQVEGGQELRLAPAAGTVLSLQHTALGKLLLAFSPAAQREQFLTTSGAALPRPPQEQRLSGLRQELTAIVQQGFAISLAEGTPDICCLAVPIRNRQAAVVAALALVLPRRRLPQLQRHDPFASSAPALPYAPLLQALRTTAERISAALP
jgi:IclR family acetate operon transcriptional repressor